MTIDRLKDAIARFVEAREDARAAAAAAGEDLPRLIYFEPPAEGETDGDTRG